MDAEQECRERAERADADGDYCEAAYYRRRAYLVTRGGGPDRDSFEDGWRACEAYYDETGGK